MSPEARREQLLDVATDLIGHHGFASVTIQALAKRAGITRPIVYEHFGSLHGLFDAVVEREMGRALAQVSETALGNLSEGDPSELMIESLRAYLAAVKDHPTTWRLVLIPPEGAPPLLRKKILGGRAEVLKSLTDAVRPGSLAGPASEDPELTARTLSALADEYARLLLIDPKRFPPERLLSHARSWVRHISE